MEGLHKLKDILRKGDSVTKVDLRDAYFTVPIHSLNTPFLCFSTVSGLYQFTFLPFSLPCAPWVFTKTLKPVLTLLRKLGVRLVACIDDILILAETEEMSKDDASRLIYLIENRARVHSTPRESSYNTYSRNTVESNKTLTYRSSTVSIPNQHLTCIVATPHIAYRLTEPKRSISELRQYMYSWAYSTCTSTILMSALRQCLWAYFDKTLNALPPHRLQTDEVLYTSSTVPHNWEWATGEKCDGIQRLLKAENTLLLVPSSQASEYYVKAEGKCITLVE